MKSSKPQSSETSSNRRAQPLRQARTNPPRTSATATRPAGGRDETATEHPIDIFPATTYFADTITALPKELVRHFTLLREVDAKICGPEEQLFDLVSEALKTTPTEVQRRHPAAETSTASLPARQGTIHDADCTHTGHPGLAADDVAESPQQVAIRRHHFRQVAYKIQEMLVALEEKNHVISTANEGNAEDGLEKKKL